MKEAIVTANTISVRAGRGRSYTKLGEYNRNDRIIVLDDTLDEEYAQVLWITGFAYSNYGEYIQFLESQLPTENTTQPNAIVTGNTISVRTGRDISYSKLGAYQKNDEIVVLDEQLDEEYAKVLWMIGFAYSSQGQYIKFVESPGGDNPNAIVTANVISVRTGRDISYSKLGEYVNADKIVVLDDTLDYKYVHVVWKDTDGYAYCKYGKYIRMLNDDVEDDVKRTIDIVKSCVGGKYIFGAQGTKITEAYVKKQAKKHPAYFTGGRYEYLLKIGKECDKSGVWDFPDDYAWDCSGLWWYSANKSGIYGRYIDTTANTFYKSYCTPIKKSQLITGDGVFYKNSSGRITHMAVVGENGVVHEAMSGYVGVITGSSVNDRTADKIVGSGTYTKKPWNVFGRPKIFK